MSAEASPSLRADLLGEVSLSWSERQVRPASRKGLALLCYLAATPRGASREEVADLLWGAGKLGSVRQALYELRKLPGAQGWLQDAGDTITVAASTDLHAFEQAVADGDAAVALALWRGALLADLSGGLPAGFVDWLEVERARLDMLRLEALQQHALDLERSGDFLGAQRRVRELLDADPLNETAYRTGMRLWYMLGDAEAAGALYRSCCDWLERDLGTRPLPETTALAERIARGDVLLGSAQLKVLPEALLALLQAVAIGGGRLGIDALAATLDRDPFVVAKELAELQRRRLLDERQELPESLVRDALAVTPDPVASLLHRRAAEYLEAVDGDRLQRAHHWLGAAERRRAYPPLLDAARWAASQADPSARAHAFRALWVAERASDRFEAAMLLEGLAEREADGDLQRDALDLAEALAWEVQDDDKLLLVRLKRTRELLRRGEVGAARSVAEEALEIAERTGDALQRARAVNGLGAAHFLAGNLDDAYATFTRNREADDPTERYRALNNLGAIDGIRGSTASAYAHFDEALTLARRGRNLDDIGACLNNLAATAERLADFERATRHLRESLSLARRTGDPRRECQGLINLAVIALVQGDFGPAWNTLTEALGMARDLGDPRLEGQALEQQAEIARHAGAVERALALLDGAERALADAEDERRVLLANCNRVFAAFQADPHDPDACLDALERVERAGLQESARWFWLELALSSPDPAAVRTWVERADASGDNPHLDLIARAALLRADLLAGAEVDADHLVSLEAELTALQVARTPLALTLLAQAWAPHRSDHATALLGKAEALLVEQGRGLPRELRASLEARLATWRVTRSDLHGS